MAPRTAAASGCLASTLGCMLNIGSAQSVIVMVLGIAAFAMEVFALVDALRRRPQAFVAAGKRTKGFWTAILVVAALLGFVVMLNPLGIFGLIAVVAAAVYLADVRPALDRVTGRGRRDGPYGPW